MFKLTALLVTLSGALGALLPGDAGYNYDRPGFAGDFGRRNPDLGRYPNRPGYGTPGYNNNNFLGRPGYGLGGYNGAGYNGRYNAGYNPDGTYRGYPGDYNGRYNNGDGAYRGYDESGRPSRPYNFQYDVRDPVSGANFGQEEVGEPNGAVRGEYRVLLPDSRTQVVSYTADDANGYVADVRYEGQAQYPSAALLPGNYRGNFYNPNLGAYQGRGYGLGGATPGYGLAGVNGGVVGANGYPGYGSTIAPGVVPANKYLPSAPNAGILGK